jgi:hypothetical protein
VQSMPDVSPTKWHRGHTTWFFEEFVLGPHDPSYEPFHPDYGYLFNSYYETVGPRHRRDRRGVVSRPGVDEVARTGSRSTRPYSPCSTRIPTTGRLAELLELGLHHEQQHQELLLMDIKHVLSRTRSTRRTARAGPGGRTGRPRRRLGGAPRRAGGGRGDRRRVRLRQRTAPPPRCSSSRSRSPTGW